MVKQSFNAWGTDRVVLTGRTGLRHALGAFGVAHRHTSCAMLAPVLRYNHSVNANRQRIVAGLLGAASEEAADAVAAQLASVAAAAMKDRWIHTNPRTIHGGQDVLEILQDAW